MKTVLIFLATVISYSAIGLNELIDSFENDIKWFESLDAAKKYVKEKDWQLEWAWHSDETKRFIEEVLNYQP